MAVTNGLPSVLWFIAVLVLIPVALWLFKRTPMGGASGMGVVRAVAALPLSPSQRIITIEVGQGEARRWLVLGVTSQSITTLHTMTPQADVPATTAPPAHAFAQMLEKLRRGPAK